MFRGLGIDGFVCISASCSRFLRRAFSVFVMTLDCIRWILDRLVEWDLDSKNIDSISVVYTRSGLRIQRPNRTPL
jgi:hypothetical protein